MKYLIFNIFLIQCILQMITINKVPCQPQNLSIQIGDSFLALDKLLLMTNNNKNIVK